MGRASGGAAVRSLPSRLGRRIGAVAVVAALLLMPLSSTSVGAARSRVAGTFREVLDEPVPTNISPFLCNSTGDAESFQDLMYRPLYWCGLGSSTAIQYPLSPALPPVESANHERNTIDLRGWSFSDGQWVDAESAAFFLNLYNADPPGYCNYQPGFGIPDQLAGVSYPGGLTGSIVVLSFA